MIFNLSFSFSYSVFSASTCLISQFSARPRAHQNPLRPLDPTPLFSAKKTKRKNQISLLGNPMRLSKFILINILQTKKNYRNVFDMYIYIYIYTLKFLIDTHFKLLNIINRSHNPSIHFIPIYSLLLHSFRFSSSNTTLLPYYPCLKAVLHFCKGKRKQKLQKLQKLQRNKKEK